MKPVVQEDVTGCGIASVATLAGLTYKKTKTLAHRLGIDIKDPRLWSDTTHVRKLLTHFNIQASYKENACPKMDSGAGTGMGVD